jgi:ABC-2 type transport system ATP-binding protein
VSAVLSVNALTKRYGATRAPAVRRRGSVASAAREALRGVGFRVGAGELVAVIGPNGAGKTTLLSILAGVQKPSSGTVSRARGGVGWAPQQPALYAKLSVAENLELFARLERLAQPSEAVARMLEQTGLRERAREPVGRLSGGNRQRVNVALALIGDPPLLALDEPSASLDPEQRERLWELLAGRAAAGVSVLFSTHDVGEAQRHADRVLVLADGRLRFDGPPRALLARGGERDGGDLERALVRFLRERPSASAAAREHPPGAGPAPPPASGSQAGRA